MPASSLYCCQRSDSMISAAARNRRIAASPLVRRPLWTLVWLFFAKTSGGSTSSRPTAVAPTPSAAPLNITERRLIRSCGWCVVSSIGVLLFGLRCPHEDWTTDAWLSSAWRRLFGLLPGEDSDTNAAGGAGQHRVAVGLAPPDFSGPRKRGLWSLRLALDSPGPKTGVHAHRQHSNATARG